MSSEGEGNGPGGEQADPMDTTGGGNPSAADTLNNENPSSSTNQDTSDVKAEVEEAEQFCLSKIFVAHKQDVKVVLGTPMGALVTCSRDETMKIWTER